MNLPTHPLWFWLILGVPFLVWAFLWVTARFGQISLKPLTPWLIAGVTLSAPAYLLLEGQHEYKALRMGFGATCYTCWLVLMWIQGWYGFERLRAPANKWYLPRSSATFSIPKRMHIVVRDIGSVSPWYVGKLGLRKLPGNQSGEAGVETYCFKDDGNAIVLTTKRGFETQPTPMLFTKKIGKMKYVLMARGVEVGPIERDRQGTRYFAMQDPEGNVIEVVEE